MRDQVSRFLQAWFAVRQIIQSANFNRFHQAGLSATQFMLLNMLPEDDTGMSMGSLAARANLKPSTIAQTVDSLEQRGLISREKLATDRRVTLIRITAQGRQFQNAAAGQFRDHMAALFRAMPRTDREHLILGLESLVRAADSNKEDRPSGRPSPHDAD